jgi:molybdenum cofactor cytidylyltransferase
MTRKSDVAALVLAAGRGMRFQSASNKLLADFGGRPGLRRVAESAGASRAGRVAVVTGHERADVEAALSDLPLEFVHNLDFASGLASSLRVGLARLDRASGVLVLLGDMPCVSPGVLDSLIETFEKAPPACAAIVPVFQGKRGNPALLSRALFTAVAELRGDCGARHLLRSAAGVLEVPVDDEGVLFDVDTQPDLNILRSRLR